MTSPDPSDAAVTEPPTNQDGPNTHKMDAPYDVTSWTVIRTTRDVVTDDGRGMTVRDEWWHVPTFVVEAIIGPVSRLPSTPVRPDLTAMLANATNGGNWRVRHGLPADRFAPDGYRYVQFGPTERAADGYGTDQLSPADAQLIVAAVDFLRSALQEPTPNEQ